LLGVLDCLKKIYTIQSRLLARCFLAPPRVCVRYFRFAKKLLQTLVPAPKSRLLARRFFGANARRKSRLLAARFILARNRMKCPAREARFREAKIQSQPFSSKNGCTCKNRAVGV
jgi:hypothetical protein